MGRTSIDLEGVPEYQTPQIKIRQRSQLELPTNGAKTSLAVKSHNHDDSHNNRDNYNQGKQNRSISIGGSVTGSAITTGDNNTATVNFQSMNLPAPESIDIRTEVNALKQILANLESLHRRKIDNAFDDAHEELNKSHPDKDEVGQALNRALKYAKKASGFISVLEKLKPHVKNATAWLGDNWDLLLDFIN